MPVIRQNFSKDQKRNGFPAEGLNTILASIQHQDFGRQ
jgi:hypothetical protein